MYGIWLVKGSQQQYSGQVMNLYQYYVWYMVGEGQPAAVLGSGHESIPVLCMVYGWWRAASSSTRVRSWIYTSTMYGIWLVKGSQQQYSGQVMNLYQYYVWYMVGEGQPAAVLGSGHESIPVLCMVYGWWRAASSSTRVRSWIYTSTMYGIWLVKGSQQQYSGQVMNLYQYYVWYMVGEGQPAAVLRSGHESIPVLCMVYGWWRAASSSTQVRSWIYTSTMYGIWLVKGSQQQYSGQVMNLYQYYVWYMVGEGQPAAVLRSGHESIPVLCMVYGWWRAASSSTRVRSWIYTSTMYGTWLVKGSQQQYSGQVVNLYQYYVWYMVGEGQQAAVLGSGHDPQNRVQFIQPHSFLENHS